MDCTFCLDCAHACPYDNVGMLARLPGGELLLDPWRSGIGRFSRRPDLAAIVILFTFGALLNAFGMVHPVYRVEAWLAELLGTQWEAPVLGIIFAVGLLVAPVILRWSGLGAPRWDVGPLLPSSWLLPLQQMVMGLGWLIWILVAYRLSAEDAPQNPGRLFLPWAVSLFLLWLVANWLLSQPMEMRGTFMG